MTNFIQAVHSHPHANDLLTLQFGSIGHIRINREQSLNALTLDVILGIHAALDRWALDVDVIAVVLDGAGHRAFCAGGDLRKIYAARGNRQFGYDIFLAEYSLNYKIANYPKPIVAIMNGITMGGGVGISVYAQHRIVTENTKFAMPECGIGLFPDVGASWFLQKCPGQIGRYLALTGAGIDAADCLYAGLADDYIAWANMPTFIQDLKSISVPSDVATTIAKYSSPTLNAPNLRAHQSDIDSYFQFNSLIEIYESLPDDEMGQSIKRMMDKNSPISMAIIWRAFEKAKGQSLAQILNTDLILSQNCLVRDEFYEGIRAAVIDKDRQARWSNASIAQVDPEAVAAHFIPPDERNYAIIGC